MSMSANNAVQVEAPSAQSNIAATQVTSQVQPSTAHGSTPSDFLSAVLGRPVTVKLNNGGEYRGILVCLDGYMNIALEQAQQFEHGQLKHSFGDAFIRGNNVFYIATCTH